MGGTYTSADDPGELSQYGCGAGDQGTWTASPSAGVVSLTINTVPSLNIDGGVTAVVPAPSTVQFYAYANGSISQDVTQEVTWTSSNPAVATITTGGSSGNGILSAKAGGGTTYVTATITSSATGALVTSNTVTVTASPNCCSSP
jgi:hypothetical protein